MADQSILIGNRMQLRCIMADADRVPIGPTGVTCQVQHVDTGEIVDLPMVFAGDEPGELLAYFDPTRSGAHTFRMSRTAPTPVAQQSTFVVEPSIVVKGKEPTVGIATPGVLAPLARVPASGTWLNGPAPASIELEAWDDSGRNRVPWEAYSNLTIGAGTWTGPMIDGLPDGYYRIGARRPAFPQVVARSGWFPIGKAVRLTQGVVYGADQIPRITAVGGSFVTLAMAFAGIADWGSNARWQFFDQIGNAEPEIATVQATVSQANGTVTNMVWQVPATATPPDAPYRVAFTNGGRDAITAAYVHVIDSATPVISPVPPAAGRLRGAGGWQEVAGFCGSFPLTDAVFLLGSETVPRTTGIVAAANGRFTFRVPPGTFTAATTTDLTVFRAGFPEKKAIFAGLRFA